MAMERLQVSADLLLKDDLIYELRVRGVSAAEKTVFALLTLYRELEDSPVLPERVAALYPDGDLTSLEEKVEQVRDLSLVLTEGSLTDKQLRRFQSKLNHCTNRVSDAIGCGEFAGGPLEQLQEWQSILSSVSSLIVQSRADAGSVADPVVLPNIQDVLTTPHLLDVRIPVMQSSGSNSSPIFAPPAPDVNQGMSFREFGKLPHPLTQLLAQVSKYSVSTLENTLLFLLFLDNVATQVNILKVDIRPVLAIIYSKLTQPLADLVGTVIQAGYDIDRLHDHILEMFFPPRARMTVIQRHYYRVQGLSEPLNEYVRDVKTYARVLRVTRNEQEVVNNILNGLSPVVRSCLGFESRPRDFAELDSLCIRVMAVLYADTLRSDSNVTSAAARSRNVSASVSGRPAPSQSRQVLCYHCRAPGHVVRNCPNRRRQGRNLQSNESVDGVESTPLAQHADSQP